jgi:Cep192 domain 4
MKCGLKVVVFVLLFGLVAAHARAQVVFQVTSVPVFASVGDPSAPLGSVSLSAGIGGTMSAGSQIFVFYGVATLLGGGATVTCSATGCAHPGNFTFSVSGTQVIINFVTDVTFSSGNSIKVGGLHFDATGGIAGTTIVAFVSAVGAVIQVPNTAAVAQTISGPSVSLSSTSLNFGNVAVGTTSSPQTVTLSNTGGGSLSISGINASPSVFVENNTCGSSVAGGSNCKIAVVFSPVGVAIVSGSLSITDNAPGSPHKVTLQGTGETGNPIPTLTTLSPAAAAVGSASLVATLNGVNFLSESVVLWNGTALPTSFVSGTELKATIPAGNMASPVAAQVAVSNPSPGGGTSNALMFDVRTPGSSPIPAGAVQTIISHSAYGGGWITRLFVANLSNASNTVTINRIDQAGTLVDSNTTVLPPGGEIDLPDGESQRSLPLTINWFAIGSQGPVIASVLFDFQGAAAPAPQNFNTAIGALASSPLAAFTAIARVTSPGGDLGLALANLNNSSNTVTIKLYDQGGLLVAQDAVTLGPYAQTAFDLTQRAAFQNLLQNTNEFDGTLQVTASDPSKPVAALVVGANQNQVFALPVTPGTAK